MVSEKEKAYRKEWRARNREKVLEQRRIRRERDREKLREQARAQYQKHGDKRREQAREAARTPEALARKRAWRAANPDKSRVYIQRWQSKNLEHSAAWRRMDRRRNLERYLLNHARARAKAKGVPFNLTIEDIVIPEKCPVFGTRFEINGEVGSKDTSASVDRVIPHLGYVKGNIRVISHKANSLKRHASAEELQLVLEYAARETAAVLDFMRSVLP